MLGGNSGDGRPGTFSVRKTKFKFEPTVSQKVAEAHDTPARSRVEQPKSEVSAVVVRGETHSKLLNKPELRTCADHLVPFQTTELGPHMSHPTASQKVGEGHDTLSIVPVVTGRFCLFHVDPLKARGIVLSLESHPSIIQKVAEAHDTGLRELTPEGRLCLFHEVPLKERAMLSLELLPTAIQKVEEGHDTLLLVKSKSELL